MPNTEPQWDIGEQVAVRSKSVRPLVGVIASSSMHVIFGALTIAGAVTLQSGDMSNSQSVLQAVRVVRKDVQRESKTPSPAWDTQQGLSTGRLAALFPVLFEPDEEEDEGEPFFMS